MGGSVRTADCVVEGACRARGVVQERVVQLVLHHRLAVEGPFH